MECWICKDDGDSLIAPCDCKGSIAHVHESCLITWIERSGSSKCGTCGHVFVIKRDGYPLVSEIFRTIHFIFLFEFMFIIGHACFKTENFCSWNPQECANLEPYERRVFELRVFLHYLDERIITIALTLSFAMVFLYMEKSVQGRLRVFSN